MFHFQETEANKGILRYPLINLTWTVLCKTAFVVWLLLLLLLLSVMSNSPFLSPKKRVCCAGFDHWREVLSLYSTRQVRFAVPPSVTVIFWTRGYWPLMPATWHIGQIIRWGDEDEERERVKNTKLDKVRHMFYKSFICKSALLINMREEAWYIGNTSDPK